MPYKDTDGDSAGAREHRLRLSPKFVGRDSPQVATRIAAGLPERDPARATGARSWSTTAAACRVGVASGGRMGGVFGEDVVEVAPPATDCAEDCQAQNQVRGQAVVLGFPFPVPAANRFHPRFP